MSLAFSTELVHVEPYAYDKSPNYISALPGSSKI